MKEYDISPTPNKTMDKDEEEPEKELCTSPCWGINCAAINGYVQQDIKVLPQIQYIWDVLQKGCRYNLSKFCVYFSSIQCEEKTLQFMG